MLLHHNIIMMGTDNRRRHDSTVGLEKTNRYRSDNLKIIIKTKQLFALLKSGTFNNNKNVIIS